MAMPTFHDPPAYKYDELRNRSVIRLINLEKRQTSKPSHGYELSTFEIGKCPRYHALSYCWGESERSEIIICNESVVRVTPHLKLGLIELESISDLRTWFWIDQICINQGDIGERSHQVQLMPQIYSRAIRTVVWLGPRSGDYGESPNAQNEDDNLFAFAKTVFLLGQAKAELSYKPVFKSLDRPRERTGWNGKLPRSRGIKMPDDLLIFGLPEISDPRWKNLASFFQAHWFSRVWVIQEVFFSPDVPYIIHNGHLRNFLHILWAGAFISQNLAIFGKMFQGSNRARITEHARLLLQLALARSQWTLGSLLWRTADYKASDQKDKFFALLSLAGEFQDNEFGRPQALVPNYRKPLGEVARDFTRYVIETSGSLLILSLINPESQQNIEPSPNTGPSWAYIPSNALASLRFGEQYILKGLPFEIQRKGHEACLRFPIRTQLSVNPDVLTISGRRCGEILEISSNKGTPKLLDWCEQGYRCLSKMGMLSLKHFLAQFFVTLSARYDFQDRDARPSISDFACWLINRSSAGEPVPEYFQDSIPELEEVARHEPGNSHTMDRWIAMYEPGGDFQHRQFGITNTGLLIVGPRSMKPGDVISLFEGGELACVLRSFQGCYLFYGECYIHDLNQSDSWKSLDEIDVEWFCLI